MADSKALAAFQTILGALDARGIKYMKDEDALKITFVTGTDDLDMDVRLFVDDEHQLVVLYSELPFKVKDTARLILARATSQANYNIAEGNFDMNLDSGTIVFRATTCYRGSIITPATVDRMIRLSLAAVDHFNDMFLALSTGAMSLDAFYAAERH